ncbi:hypothetical protein Syun_026534 [Stephania yunnanensis]|uniref:ATPase dynein-related AAA domain-containing protein n=1 Tax=Stephania yunnanensis TaxID=152371 RepID=A0AAP0F2M0_9MAGN
MSIDGTFTLESALQRFLARCPDLQRQPHFASLSQKGERLEEEELVNAVAGVFVDPKYTIAAVGCFRAIARKIVDRVVELLEKVGGLGADCGGESMEVDVDDRVEGVIEACVRHGQGLRLHELACLAFCRALDMAPFLLEKLLNYFKFAPPPFQRLLATSFCITKNGTQLLGPVRTSFRFLILEAQVFRKLWDWSPFMDLVQQCMNVNPGNSPEYLENILNIRWCGIQILSVLFKLGDKATVNFGLDAEQSLLCLLRWEEFCQDTSIEKAGFYIGTNGKETSNHVDCTTTLNQECALQSFGLLTSVYSQDEKSDPFVLTSALKKSFEIALLAVGKKWPVLFYGPTGAGKTALINKLAQLSGNQVLSIHMDEQMDEKTLIGSYVCAERPGEFRWQPGSLTQALLSGMWVVFEDIDKAPSDVQSILLPLLEGSNSFFTGRGEVINVSERFRLFATVSTLKNDIASNSEGLWVALLFDVNS